MTGPDPSGVNMRQYVSGCGKGSSIDGLCIIELVVPCYGGQGSEGSHCSSHLHLSFALSQL